ncbi:lipoate synthase [uncultured Desulfobacterium sp.]|uniref:Lipoyl synthase n=1 Tax=uncultured Desulfobacterium sp. TaxID=201089 RepID=A0A445MT06_9BACT|nr:lipoate synthase [uncultured Desulfobacterium sp.]
MKNTFPPWIKWKAPDPTILQRIKGIMEDLELHTICESARCPNTGQCFSQKTATFLILGDVCSRMCTFCAVKKGVPQPVNEKEPLSIVEAVRRLALHYVVITSVTRDDLADGGASQFAKIIDLLHKQRSDTVVEVLVPDFLGSFGALKAVVAAVPQVVNHNIETVPRLYAGVRPKASYERSLVLLSNVKRIDPSILTKSGLMVGLGERKNEVIEVMRGLKRANCDLLTIGQYLRPSPNHHEVLAFVTPEEFSQYENVALEMGFRGVASGPLVRSSFKAEELYLKAKSEQQALILGE